MSVGMHLTHSTNHPEGVSDGLYETSVMLADGGSGITDQETDTGWSALLVEQCHAPFPRQRDAIY